ncbi:MAG: HAD-IA family hydrolase [Zymomonas mobilis subsp. pomaceae]|uniref:Phosphoglycolate phosphatase n=1 Tax=Zymomonas mobilis subsp. pomaceae (strain ATCC 29192 / DSM 22645 / JCM 10191 / CCUG 17912 / NBRC 13757 / NCIMB 11200 / NRRL B-4491 / Barker I) TaxID=579138 RepID=F8ES47_ZYMMT|nr:HAD-IA family hydrolase [Zymomonas mobilis]AEI37622.1 phosphoglycolate phosphatase [Zymomonas mobilis subsp. pomaceae ATCC 29192]MDX5948990.1 HAD-IA family hydrolase [Zymomonas mobilis subsp. pomaceae]GEB88795.1 phosphoglycolate phosphatase, bacterial [Zymomonas mobilis subsp. pomaceae]
MTQFPFSVVGFDLDGTLIDSSADLHAALDYALTEMGRQVPPQEQVEKMIGKGIRQLLEQALEATGGKDDTLIARGFPLMLEYYKKHVLVYTEPFEGVEPALKELKARGVKLIIYTNKPECLARPIIAQLGWSSYFSMIIGGDSYPVRKPDPRPLLEAIRTLGGGKAAFVGDSITDVKTGHNGHLPVILVSFGYSDVPVKALGADQIIDDYHELIPALASLQKVDMLLSSEKPD